MFDKDLYLYYKIAMSSSLQYYNIQNPTNESSYVSFSGQTSMSAAATGKKTDAHSDKDEIKEGFTFTDDVTGIWNTMNSDSKYDMSNKLVNFPQGHPLYVPQTLADTYSSDSKSLMDMEEIVMGFALLGGVTILVVGLLISNGVVSGSTSAPST